jgi:hypothetical protein
MSKAQLVKKAQPYTDTDLSHGQVSIWTVFQFPKITDIILTINHLTIADKIFGTNGR